MTKLFHTVDDTLIVIKHILYLCPLTSVLYYSIVKKMMRQLPTPPASPAVGAGSANLPSTTGKSSAELSRELDRVLGHYLVLLDQQQRLQEEIGREFSSGFFSLARANNSCPPGRRYGEDYYDERMKSIKKLSIIPASKLGDEDKPTMLISNQRRNTPSFTIENVSLSSFTLKEPKKDTENKNDEACPNSPSPSRSSDPNEPDRCTGSEKSSTNRQSFNPLNWFGILVPPALRNAQQSFCTALEGPITTLAGVITEMHEVEREVEALRGMLALATIDDDGSECGKQ
ncbi:hypothetical protein ACJ73_01441 [Blastomyces percursus]|uniref:Vacuolar ATPase assembly protein VMA22 n=1 Tax=Blastomyces percursus TaxID=1658174 RepID=A0A1J9QGE0_9EURO|nr:hypothetical protein ACJ73_01441 [Blastomyces percursus]